jgi:hypothetical protein
LETPVAGKYRALVKAGENQLEISVTNHWNNRIVGDLQPDAKQAFTRSIIKSKPIPHSCPPASSTP